MELKIFRDTMPQAGTVCTVKAELPLETEILVSDYLPPVFKLVKCFAKPVILQKQLQPGRLTLEGYLRCTVYYQGEEGTGLCQTEQKLPFTKQLELPEFDFTAWTAVVEGQTEYLNSRVVNPRRMEVRGAVGLVATVRTQNKAEVITALADGGIEQQLDTLQGVRSIAVLDKLISAEGELAFPSPSAAVLDIAGTATAQEVRLLSGKAVVKGEVRVQCAWRAEQETELQSLSTTLPFQQVLDVDGAVIPGLYAAGECVGGIWGRFVSGGTGVMGPIVFGRLAARAAMANEPATGYTLKTPVDVITEDMFAKDADGAESLFDMSQPLADGEYEATVDGQEGPMTVKVTVADGKIAAVVVAENHETQAVAAAALEKVPQAIVDANSVDVDGVSGATLTSGRIKDAAVKCLTQAAQ